jgi:hypothetical protein
MKRCVIFKTDILICNQGPLKEKEKNRPKETEKEGKQTGFLIQLLRK